MEMMRAGTGWCKSIVSRDEMRMWSVANDRDLKQSKIVLPKVNSRFPEAGESFSAKRDNLRLKTNQSE